MIPEKFVRDGLEMASGTTVFAVKFEDMTRDELIAVAAQGWAAERRAREQAAADRKFSRELAQARRMA